jgi:hypothetical protein
MPLELGSVNIVPLKISASSETPVSIKNIAGGTLYYKTTENVSSASNDGTIIVGNQVTFNRPTYIVSGSTTQFNMNQKQFANTAKFSRWPTFYADTENTGNNTTPVAGTFYYIECKILADSLLTGFEVVNGETVGTDKLIAWIWDQNGYPLGNSALAGTTSVGAKAFQQLAFETAVLAPEGRYFVGVQTNGTTTRLATAKAGTVNMATGSVTGTFAEPKNITVPTTFTANVGPLGTTY